jgi:hypothetical protein
MIIMSGMAMPGIAKMMARQRRTIIKILNARAAKRHWVRLAARDWGRLR